MVNNEPILKYLNIVLEEGSNDDIVCAIGHVTKTIFKGIFINRLQGYINFVGQVRGKTDSLYIRLKTAFDSVFNMPEIAK